MATICSGVIAQLLEALSVANGNPYRPSRPRLAHLVAPVSGIARDEIPLTVASLAGGSAPTLNNVARPDVRD